ncbi:MAG: thiamine-phosphate kinase [Actinobacteria bacterium]|nr:thiamine-phosphate kinase [Actinomycetota bacterium]
MFADEKKVSESDVIRIAESIFKRTSAHSKFYKRISVPIGDDCFSFRSKRGEKIVVTTDALVENVHFNLSYFKMKDLGYRSIAVNVSDLASHGAYPAFLFLTVGLKPGFRLDDLSSFFSGVEEACKDFGCVLAGGDTNRSDILFISVTAVGFAKNEMSRSGAKPGDFVCITGTLGLSAAGFFVLEKGIDFEGFENAVERFLKPKPRIEEGKILASSGVLCCEDVSDGLVRELRNIAERSKVGFEVFTDQIPVARELKVLQSIFPEIEPLKIAVSFGDDYELVFVADEPTIRDLANKNIEFTVVGRVVEKERGIKFSGLFLGNLPDGYEHKF